MTCQNCHGNDFILDCLGEPISCPVCTDPDTRIIFGNSGTSSSMPRAEILEAAKKLITEDRHRQHGDAHITMKKIAQYWTTYRGVNINGSDGCMMMALLKIARQQFNSGSRDNYQDSAGYEALAWEISLREKSSSD